ncbi:MAG: ribonuclease J [Ancalomicrobiaceae bacterium]|nr:ribonuclease J [Ancalomicrobiaceae bacterium]
MNLSLYGFGPKAHRKWLMVDLGITFASEFDEPGVDVILPDIEFIEKDKRNLVGIVITHAHEDHFGGLIDLWPRLGAPLYMTPFAAGLLEAKLESEAGAPEIPIRRYTAGDRLNLEPFDVEAISVAHSIPESVALAIRTALGTVVHTGDWKIDPTPVVGWTTDLDRLTAIGSEGVRALICDSTNVVRDGISPSERDVAQSLTRIISEAPARVAVTTFASNIARVRSVAEAAHAAGRNVIVMGRAMRRAIDVASELGMFDGLPDFLDEDAFSYLPRNKVVALMTGSQGEQRAALAKVALGDHRTIKLAKDDIVIFSSRTIPGNEKSVGAVVNGLAKQGARIISDRDALVHVSGHPRRGELIQMYRAVQPQVAVPVHGEALHLSVHASFARELGVPVVIEAVNGNVVRLAPGEPGIIEEVAVGRLFRDGKLVVRPDKSGVKERRKAGFAGVAVVSIILDEKGDQAVETDVVTIGIPEVDNRGVTFDDIAVDAVDNCLKSMPRARRRDHDAVADSVTRAVKAAIGERWGKKPIVEVLIAEV